MSLFIGNIAHQVSSEELEKIFSKFGKVRINYKGAYAFAEFDEENSAKQAKDEIQSQQFNGRSLNIEWSKKSKYYEGKERNSPSPIGKCYNCRRRGHYARDCPERRHSSVSRRRYHGRRYHSRSHSHHHHRRYSRSRSSRSRSDRRRYRRRRRYSRSSSDSKDSKNSRRSGSSKSNSSHRSDNSRNRSHYSDDYKKNDKNCSIEKNDNDMMQDEKEK